METISTVLDLLKRQAELEEGLRRPGGIRVTEEGEIYALRKRLQCYPQAVAAILQAARSLNRPVDTLQPLFFHHGWPLSADDWDAQMMFFLGLGYRVIAHDRRGHGRSSQTAIGHNMDTYAADVAELVSTLDLKDAIHIGHSTGGGEVARYVAQHGKGRVAKAVLISAIPPTFMKSERNPDGVPKEVVDGIRDGTANHRSQFYMDITLPFYGYNRPGAQVSEGIRQNWWRQGMMGAIKAQYDCVKVLSETEFYDDLKIIDVPVLVMHGEDDQICPFTTTGARSVKLLKRGTLKSYPGLPHGMPTTHAERINADLLEFIRS